jgi:hypothetical protein
VSTWVSSGERLLYIATADVDSDIGQSSSTSDFAYLLSMLKTAPLVATVGLSLTIPLAVFIDLLMGTHSGGTMANIGSLAVLLSFVAIGWDDTHSAGEERAEEDVVRGRRGSSASQDDDER